MPAESPRPESLRLPATTRSPEVEFDYAGNRLALRGKSYPEDSVAFYVPVLHSLKEHLAGLAEAEIVVDLQLQYFNSSSAKALMNMLLLLEEAAGRGNRVIVRWHYADEDETMQEYGEEFAEDLEKVEFQLVPVPAG